MAFGNARSSATEPAIWGMLPTPFDAHGDVDESSVQRLARSFAGFRCTDLVLFGVIAEPETLTLGEKLRIVAAVRRAVPRVRITVAALGATAPAALHEVESLSALLAPSDRIMADVVDEDAGRLTAHLEAIRGAGGSRELVLQDYARSGGAKVDIEVLADVLAAAPYVVGVKEETAPTYDRIRRLARIPNLTVVGGLGGASFLDDMRAGARGLAIGVTVPERLVQALWRWRDGDVEGAAEEVAKLSGLISFETQPGRSVGIRKEHWRRRGVIDTAVVRRAGEAWTSELEPHSMLHLSRALGTGRR